MPPHKGVKRLPIAKLADVDWSLVCLQLCTLILQPLARGKLGEFLNCGQVSCEIVRLPELVLLGVHGYKGQGGDKSKLKVAGNQGLLDERQPELVAEPFEVVKVPSHVFGTDLRIAVVAVNYVLLDGGPRMLLPQVYLKCGWLREVVDVELEEEGKHLAQRQAMLKVERLVVNQ
ncbi:hypothetical protein K504DRAFT_508891 [Pleomassaria siparia CBS 279.74]|uniref:Uncharacterized protein n=1 Tax=Pleomassaria siparia CBS 279.74 TaxID=1314801 RepID=A0A6G1JPP3_9PLEO|nr:hypothetical protein K504DRAFT_508891 [Pleomassaria siparia CBS 279.74]